MLLFFFLSISGWPSHLIIPEHLIQNCHDSHLKCSHPQLERQGKSPDKLDAADTRQWTVKHLDAANIPHNSLSALTPPQGEDNLQTVIDVNVRGPGG